MVEVNPHYISQLNTGATIGHIEDDVDFPHTGLFKSLMQGVSGNFVIKNNTNDFDITQSASDPVVSVAVGSYLDNGELKTTSGVATFNAAAFTFTTNKAYYLLVVNSSGTVALRVPTTANRVANHSAGDTIIAMIEIADDTAFGSRKVQFFTSSKTKNSLSIARDNSGAYTESASIKSNSGDIEIEALEQDKDIIFKVNDGGSSTEAMRIDGATAKVGIGTTTPANPLHVKQTATTSGDAVYTARFQSAEGNVGMTRYGGIHINNDNSSPTDGADWDTERWQISERDTNQFDIAHGSATNTNVAASNTILRILSTGKVGINKGSSDPSVELDVAGAITSSGTITGVIGALTTVNATDVNTANITSTANQNLSYEVITAATPISGLKTVVYAQAINGNTAALPAPASGNILTVVNLDAANPITLTPSVGSINNGAVGHPKLTAPNVITLAPFEHVTLQAVNDTLGVLQTGHMIISD